MPSDVLNKVPYYQYISSPNSLTNFLLNKNAKVEIIECKYEPERIIKNGPAMIVFWKDGTKTVVKRKKGEPDNIYHAFTAALAKKIFGSNSKVNSIVVSVIDETKKSKKTTKNNK